MTRRRPCRREVCRQRVLSEWPCCGEQDVLVAAKVNTAWWPFYRGVTAIVHHGLVCAGPANPASGLVLAGLTAV